MAIYSLVIQLHISATEMAIQNADMFASWFIERWPCCFSVRMDTQYYALLEMKSASPHARKFVYAICYLKDLLLQNNW